MHEGNTQAQNKSPAIKTGLQVSPAKSAWDTERKRLGRTNNILANSLAATASQSGEPPRRNSIPGALDPGAACVRLGGKERPAADALAG